MVTAFRSIVLRQTCVYSLGKDNRAMKSRGVFAVDLLLTKFLENRQIHVAVQQFLLTSYNHFQDDLVPL